MSGISAPLVKRTAFAASAAMFVVVAAPAEAAVIDLVAIHKVSDVPAALAIGDQGRLTGISFASFPTIDAIWAFTLPTGADFIASVNNRNYSTDHAPIRSDFTAKNFSIQFPENTFDGAASPQLLARFDGNVLLNSVAFRVEITAPLLDATGPFDGSYVVVAHVPELSTWAMMLIGFGGVGLRMRRRNSLAGSM